MDENNFMGHSWREGLFCYYIERNYYSGEFEIICRIWKWKKDARNIVINITNSLSYYKTDDRYYEYDLIIENLRDYINDDAMQWLVKRQQKLKK